jgi:putative tryptophan/tyrosine transport system substrate-binding protein
MKRMWFAGALTNALLTILVPAYAQPVEKVWRIGWLGLDSSMQATRIVAFENGLRDLGYVEGKNISIERRWAEGRFERLPALASELVAARVDVIVTASPPGVRAARQATGTIPIVMIAHEPVRMGFVESLARPGGNITGIAFQDTELSEKRLDLFRQTVPRLSKLAILWNGVEGTDPESLRSIEDAAKAMGLQVLSVEVREPKDFAKAIAAAKSWGAEGMVEMASPFITKNRKIFLDLLKTNRLPATCEMRMYVAEGCLMTYSANLDAMFRREAYFVDRILKGASPGDLAVEQPREFEFVINLRTAQQLGLAVPSAIRAQATEVIP